jgi:hypothetical protein
VLERGWLAQLGHSAQTGGDEASASGWATLPLAIAAVVALTVVVVAVLRARRGRRRSDVDDDRPPPD